MANDENVAVGLGAWTPPDPYDTPQLERRGSKQPADIAGPVETVESHDFGDEAVLFTLRGKAYADDISVLQKYRGKPLTLRHPAYSGKVYIESIRADTTDRWDELTEFRIYEGEMQDVTEEKQVYTYSVDLITVEGDNEGD